MGISRSAPLLSAGIRQSRVKRKVIVLAVEQPAGKRVVFAHQLVAAGGGRCDVDLDRAAVELNLRVESGGVDGAGGDRVGDQFLHGDECVVGLGGPAPVNVWSRGVGDGGQLRLGVGAAQLVFDVDVTVIGCPRVVHRHATEALEGAGRVQALAAALGVAGDQGVLAGAGAVDPVQRARHAQAGLVETGHLGGGDTVAELGEEVTESVDGAFGHRRHGAFRDRGGEQFGQCAGGALFRQELAHILVEGDRSDSRPIVRRRCHAPAWCRRWWFRTGSGAR